MKKFIWLPIIFLSVVCAILITGCKDPEPPEEQYYAVTYSSSEGGTISGAAEQSVKEGEDGTEVVAVPDTGYKFVKWSDGVTTPARQDKNVTADIFVTAEFKVKIVEQTKEYTVTYLANEGGTIDGIVKQSVKEGENGTVVVAVPSTGYKFAKWSDEVTTPERQEKNVTADITVTAVFEKQTYTLSYVAGDGGYLIGNANQTVVYGDNATTVTAIPNDGYKFVKWSDDVTTDTRRDTEINSAITVTAEFEFLFTGGEGTQLNPYKIESYTQLLNMRYYPEKVYLLTCDLDLSGINHKPIFDANEYFAGMFFGGGNTIKNLTVETEGNFPSLFGMVLGGLVENFNLENVSITTTDFNTIEVGMQYYVGTVAGYFAGRIDNVNVSGNITMNAQSSDGIAVGGLAGMAMGAVNDCNVDIQLNVKNVFSINTNNMNLPFVFGGMLGVGDSVKIRNCHAQGEILVNECYWIENETYNRPTEIYIGGLIGYYFTYLNGNAEIVDSVTSITITGDNHYNAGGFVGYLEVNQGTSLIISDCSVLGNIKIGVVGGFIFEGYADGELHIVDCFTDCEITGYSRAAGFIYRFNGVIDSCFVRNCYSLSNIKIHNMFDAEKIVGEAWGLGYQISDVYFINCYSSGNIYCYRGGGFIWALSYGKIYCCYSNCKITLLALTGSSVFTYNLRDTEVENCYSISDVVYDSQTKQNAVSIIGSISNGKINNFYYAGNSVGTAIRLIEDTKINNFHVLRTISTEDIIGEDRGETPSLVDITAYGTTEEMYFLADKLNEGQDEDVWVNVENGLPQLKIFN